MSQEWAEKRNVTVDPYPADWDNLERPGAVIRKNRYGRSYDVTAGFHRNMLMLRTGRPDEALGFPGGKGTKDMAIQCLEVGLTPTMMLMKV
jgi:hypothetical protein